jgi:hypothetical protein
MTYAAVDWRATMDENAFHEVNQLTKRRWGASISPWVRIRLIALVFFSVTFIVSTRTARWFGGLEAEKWFFLVWVVGLVLTCIFGPGDDGSDKSAEH